MKTWVSYFDKIESSLYGETLRLAPLIELVLKYVEKSASKLIVEAGCGTGTASLLIGEMGFKVTAFDIDPEVIRRIESKTAHFMDKASFEVGDMCRCSFPSKHFGVSFSQGVHEHFSDELIISAIKEQLRISEYVVIDIPNLRHKIQNYGDERLMAPDWWRSMFDRAGGCVVEERGRMLPGWTRFLPQVFHNYNRHARVTMFSKYLGMNSLFVLTQKRP